MADANSTPNFPNPATELAKERNRAAEERTLMAWIRTSLSLIGFGFGIDRIIAAIQQSLGDAVNPVRLTRILGLSFVALGTFAMLYARSGPSRATEADSAERPDLRPPAFSLPGGGLCAGGVRHCGICGDFN